MYNAPGRRDLGHRWTIGRTLPSRRSGLNRGPFDYESSALPLSYAGDCESDCKRLRNTRDALARTRTATPCGTTPSRWRVYQFHHQGNSVRRLAHSPATPWTSKPTSCTRTTLTTHQPTGLTGLEPATSGVTDRHSNQLSYSPNYSQPLRGIAPTGIEPVSPP